MTDVRQSPSGQILSVSGGGGGVPLVRGKFVDPATTVPTLEQTGAATAPFKTVQAAISALPTPSGGSVFLSPAQYPAESLVVAGKTLTLIGLVGPQTDPDLAGSVVDMTACDITSDTTLGLVNVQIGPVDTESETPSAVTLDGSTVTTLACSDLVARFSAIEQLQASGDVQLVATSIEAVCAVAGDLIASGQPGPRVFPTPPAPYSLPDGSTVGGTALIDGYAIPGLSADAAKLRDCHIPTTLTVANESFIQQCDFESGATIVGGGGTEVSMDQATLASFLTVGGSLTDCTLLRTDVAPSASTQNATGAAPIAHPLLPLGAPSGTYLWTAQVSNEAAADAGTLTLTLSYDDPDTGAATIVREAIDLSDTGVFSLSPLAFQSAGGAVSVAGVFADIAGGPPSVNVYDAVTQVG